nr:hypothetical protein GCM10020093_008410 [Planobispora longispora]
MELVHDFSLLHDDVIDGDAMRRRRPAAWTVFGVGSAVLTGDTLITLALDLLAGSPMAAKVLTTALLELCRGQNADLVFERRTDVTIAECVAMAAGKTGALLGCACELGAWAAAPTRPGRPGCASSASIWAWPSSWSMTCSASGEIPRSPANPYTAI